VYSGAERVACHARAQGKHQDVVDPEHVRALTQRKQRAARGVLVQRFLALAPCAEDYLKGLVHAEVALYRHLRRILALADLYGAAVVAAALAHALAHRAFGADYIDRIVHEQRRRHEEPEPLSPAAFTRSPELFDITLPTSTSRSTTVPWARRITMAKTLLPPIADRLQQASRRSV